MRRPIRYFRIVGEIASEQAGLDLILLMYISWFAYDDADLVTCLLAGSDTRTLLNALGNIFRNRITEKGVLNKFESLTEQLRRLAEKRNKFIHSTYFYSNTSRSVMRIKTRYSGDSLPKLFDLEPRMKIKDLQKHLEDFTIAAALLVELLNSQLDVIRQSYLDKLKSLPTL